MSFKGGDRWIYLLINVHLLISLSKKENKHISQKVTMCSNRTFWHIEWCLKKDTLCSNPYSSQSTCFTVWKSAWSSQNAKYKLPTRYSSHLTVRIQYFSFMQWLFPLPHNLPFCLPGVTLKTFVLGVDICFLFVGLFLLQSTRNTRASVRF